MNKITVLYKQYGFGVLSRLLKSGFRKLGLIYETILVFEKQLSYEDLNNHLVKFDISDVKKLTINDLDFFSESNKSKKEIYRERFKNGSYLVFGIFDNNKLVYYSWVSLKRVGLPFGFKSQISLGKNEALLEDSFCDPNYRGLGYHSKVNIVRQKAILDTGRTKAKVFVIKDNKPAIRVQLKSGFSISDKIILLKIFKKISTRIQGTRTDGKN